MYLKTILASSIFPFETNHLGLSGMKMNPQNWIAEGTAAKPNIHFHPCSVCEKSPQITAATNWPKVMIKVLQETKRPRNFGGDASEMYMGTDMEAKPIRKDQL